MIEKIRISLWDIFVTFLSGILLTIFIIMHWLIFKNISFDIFVTDLQKISSIITVFMIVPCIFLFGLMIDAISIALDDLILNRIFKTTLYQGKMLVWEKLIRDKYMPKKLPNEIIPYFWSKYYLEQNGIYTPEQTFTGKFGFYRVAATISYVNIFIIPFLYGFKLSSMLFMSISFVLGMIFSLRSKKFFFHATKTIFLNYLTCIEHRKRIK